MPIYEYVCMQCESHFEELVRGGVDPDCPDCGAANVRKQFSVFAPHGGGDQPSFGHTAAGGCCCGVSCGCGHYPSLSEVRPTSAPTIPSTYSSGSDSIRWSFVPQ